MVKGPRVELDTLFSGKERSENVYWDDDDNKKLADRIVELTRNKPFDSFKALIDQAQKDVLEPDQHRQIVSRSMVPKIVKRIRERVRELHDKAKAFEDLEAQIESTPTREEVIASLTEAELREKFLPKLFELVSDEEVRERLLPRLFDTLSAGEVLERIGENNVLDLIESPRLIGYCVYRYLAEGKTAPPPIVVQLQQQHAKTNGHSHSVKGDIQLTRPRVAIIGGAGRFAQLLKARIGESVDLTVLEGKTDTHITIPTSATCRILWTNHCSAKVVDVINNKYGRIETYTGGVAQLADRILQLV